MRGPRRRGHPARPFVISILVFLSLAALSYVGRAVLEKAGLEMVQQLNARSIASLAEEAKGCRAVNQAENQCAFIRSHCDEEDSGLFSYLELYYCRMSHLKPVAFTIIVVWISLLFSTIGIAASDFFCVNLSTISSILGMSESMAGVTFLAFGNGSPDVFSTFAAMKTNSGSLALGELYGAAGFITAIVAGSMALVRPFKVAKRSFVRDICFFIVAISFSMVFLANGALSVWECAVMVGFYVFYVVTVVIWHWWLGRRRQRREREAAARGHYVLASREELAADEEYHEDEGEVAPRLNAVRSISADDFAALERAGYQDLDLDQMDELDEEQVRDKWLGEISSNMRVTMPPDGERRQVFNPIRPSLVGALEFRAVLKSLQRSRNQHSVPIHMRRYSEIPLYRSAPQSETHSIHSNPDTTDAGQPARVEPYNDHVPSKLKNHRILLGPRVRAVSASDADGLDFDAASFNRTPPQIDILSASPPPMDESEAMDIMSQGRHDTAAFHSHLLGPAASTLTADQDANAHAQRGNEMHSRDLLVPPDPSGHGDMARNIGHLAQRSSHSFDHAPQKRRSTVLRPHLKISLPGSSPFSTPATHPSRSPRILQRDNSFNSIAVSSVPSLLLPPAGASDESEDYGEEDNYKPPRWWPIRLLPPPPVVARALFPTIYGWREKNIWEKFLGIAAAPSFFLLTLTLPVVDPVQDGNVDTSADLDVKAAEPYYSSGETEPSKTAPATGAVGYGSTARAAIIVENGTTTQDELETAAASGNAVQHTSEATTTPEVWNRWLVLIHCFTSPLFVLVIISTDTSPSTKQLLRSIMFCLLGSLVANLLILLTTTPFHPPKWHFMLCFVGFAVSVTWISTIAEEVVAVLKAIGVIFNISDAILGLTIFAVGNSLSDLVANITVARLGYPVMALSACFGGPMLNILLGIGLSGLYVTITGAQKRQRKHPARPVKYKPYHVHVSATLLISAIALLITLVGLLIFVPLNKWKMDRKIGLGLIALWVASTIVNLAVEITGVLDAVTAAWNS